MLCRRASIVIRGGVRGMGGAIAQIEVNLIIIILVLLSAIHVGVVAGLGNCTLCGFVVIGIV